MQEWAKELGNLTPDQISAGLKRLPDSWPPTSKEFRKLCLHETGNASFREFAPALPMPKVEPEYVESQLAEMRKALNENKG